MRAFLILVFFLTCYSGFSQQKSLEAFRISDAPKINGVLDDSCWLNIIPAKDFIQRDLHPGLPSEQKTEVRIVYDDEAVYIAARMFDSSPDSILHELSTRDNEANADLFGIFLDTYNDDINAFGFFVTAAGTQIDARYSENGQDFDWNAVWISAVKIDQVGWVAEFKIPYSALRFPKKDFQDWGLNLIRKVRRLRENSFWNPIDPKITALIRQSGDLTGLRNIKPPVRLSLSPYIAGIVDHYPYQDPDIKDLSYNFSGGMDVKYGLTDAFTLDMTLVPDFSQVQSDNQVLNLSPFEVQFQERRPFFTEGTELFNKGGLFYSRRVGGTPIDFNAPYRELKDGETVVRNPSQTQLINASKLSGRTSSKLGVGLFNAVANSAHATIHDSAGNSRHVLTSPLTNYNIVVLDQAMRNNSSLSFINTNVLRDGHFYDANVTGTVVRLNDKKNNYTLGGSAMMSSRFFSDSSQADNGYAANIDFGKSGGNFKWNAFGRLKTDRYNPNDLGILFLSNNFETGLNLGYHIYKPFWKVNNLHNNVTIIYQRMYNPSAFWNFGIYGNHNTTFSKQFFTCGIDYGIEPVITYDYYEPRVPNRFYTFPVNYGAGGFMSSDYRKPFALDISGNYRVFNENRRSQFNIGISPRFRVNNRLSFIYDINNDIRTDDIGFVNYNPVNDTITFGKRNMQTVNNVFSSVYKFSNKMSLSFRLRHYWSAAYYTGYFALQQDGGLAKYNYERSHDVNFNAFNVDMVYFWQFAPGSELNIVWKNALLKRDNLIVNDYYENFRGSLNSPQNNMVSVKVLYYIDYLTIRKAVKSKDHSKQS